MSIGFDLNRVHVTGKVGLGSFFARMVELQTMLSRVTRVCVCLAASTLLSSCKSSIVGEAIRAESEGEVISNQLMAEMYPKTFHPGSPAYLERDYEAGADFICNQIKLAYKRDICAEPKINWRR
jgi:hypothetical protein